MKSRVTLMMAMAIAWPCLSTSAQVMPAGKAPRTGHVQRASCQACDSGMVDPGCGVAGTVWGTQCLDCNFRPGLYPPCPNPCQTTLLTDLVCGVKGAVDTSLSHLVCCLFGGPTFPCGCEQQCTCEAGCGAEVYGGGCDSYGDMMLEGGVVSPSPLPAQQPSLAPQQPVPTPMSIQPNPFTDDASSPAFQPIPNASAARQTPRMAPRTRSLSRNRTPQARAVQRVSHEAAISESPSERSPEATVPTAKPSRHGHYGPRRATSLRMPTGESLRKTPIKATPSDPAIRFRDRRNDA